MSEYQESPRPGETGIVARIHKGTVIVLQAVLAVELVFVILNNQWLNVFLILTIITVTLLPMRLRRLGTVDIPPELHILAIAFVFASLFLGEIRSYYQRFWWWDIALHVSSGLLLGLLGFLLVYVLNENEEADIHMRPRFVALFAFVFALAVGTVWEIFEFGIDRMFGTTMQKPTIDDPSGLSDTMWDLVVDALGALCISVLGWWYLESERRSFISDWIRRFIERNPQMFRS